MTLRAALLLGAALAVTAGCRRAAAPTAPASPKLTELRDILRSRNDNDPRLDSDFDGLTPEEKSLLREEYAGLPRESRNERGTVVYLLGRNLVAAEDWAFLRGVVAEPPCLSLADCARSGPRGDGDEVTLAYPALVALRQAARAKATSPDEAARVFALALASPIPAVVRLASRAGVNPPSR